MASKSVHQIIADARIAKRAARAACFRGPAQEAYRAALAALRSAALHPLARPADAALARAEFRSHDYKEAL